MTTALPEPIPSENGWARGTLVGFDLETTGTDPTTARIVTAAVVHQLPDGSLSPASRTWLVDPGIDIPPAATAVHGISTEHARAHGRAEAEAVAEIVGALRGAWAGGLPVVVFNATYDLTLVSAALRRHGSPALDGVAEWPAARVLDPLVIDRGIDRYRRGKRTLGAVAEHYRTAVHGAHSADGDAVTVCNVARAIASAHPAVGAADLDALHAMQQEWHRQWAVHFQAYVRSRGQAQAVIAADWPLQGG